MALKHPISKHLSTYQILRRISIFFVVKGSYQCIYAQTVLIFCEQHFPNDRLYNYKEKNF